MNEFAKRHFGEPKPIDKQLYDLAREYYDRCEAYDRTVCTGPMGKDGILPSTTREHGLINRHALAVLKDVTSKAVEAGYTESDLRDAMRVFVQSR